MALEDQASLQLTIEVREALANIEAVRAKYDAALKDMAAATKANLDPASAEFQHILGNARAAGDELLAAGEKGRQALVKMGEQGVDTSGAVQDLQAGVGVLRAQVTSLGSDGSKSFDIFSASADKAAVKLKSFGAGLVAGLAISTLTGLIDGATEGAKDFFNTIIEGEPVIAEFGAKIQALDNTRAVVAERAARLEAEQVKAQTGTRLSLDEVTAAVSKRHHAMVNAERAYAKAISQSTDLRDITDAEAEKKRALAAAEADYIDTLREGNAERERELDLTQRLNEKYDEAVSRKDSILDKLVGSSEDIDARIASFTDAVAAIEESGKVHKNVAASISEDLQDLIEDLEKWGRPIPAVLRELRKEYPPLEEAQDKTTASAKKLAEAQREAAAATKAAADAAAAAAAAPSKDPFGRELDPEAAKAQVETLRERRDALEAEANTGAASLEVLNELAEVKGELATAEGRLSEALRSGVQAWQGAQHALHGQEVALGDTTSGLVDAAEASRLFAEENKQTTPTVIAMAKAAMDTSLHLDEAADGSVILADGVRQVRTEVPLAGRAIGDMGTISKEAAGAIRGLADNQGRFNAEAGAMAAATEEAGLQAGTMGKRMEELAKRIEKVEDAIVKLTAETGKAFDPELVETWTAIVETRAIPAAERLKACLDSIN